MPKSPTNANRIARIESEVGAFVALVESLPAARYRVERLADCAYRIAPQVGTGLSLPPGKDVALTLMALTHGNEVGNVVVLNELVRALLGGVIELHAPIMLVLGNPEAARREQRFVDRDLNRSFLLAQADSTEARRAGELEQLLARTAYLVDFHQTREISENPFFIFPYTRAGFLLAQAIAPQIPVVTHWGRPFSSDGRCSDEFVNTTGGVGITIEVGQNGYAPFSIGAGFWVATQALRVIATLLAAGKPLQDSQVDPQIYTWLEILPYGDGDVTLLPGWHNFSHVSAGQQLGSDNGRAIVAPAEAWLLFPQYPKPGDLRRPAELCRLMRRISVADLPS